MRIVSYFLAFILTTMTINSSYASSRMMTTLEVVDGISLEQNKEKIISFINGQEIQKKLISMGIEPREAIQRVGSLSPREINLLSEEIDKAPAGGDFGVGSIIGAALLIFIVLLITDILGFTKVFTFTRAVQ